MTGLAGFPRPVERTIMGADPFNPLSGPMAFLPGPGIASMSKSQTAGLDASNEATPLWLRSQLGEAVCVQGAMR
jgi:hypothetical protein